MRPHPAFLVRWLVAFLAVLSFGVGAKAREKSEKWLEGRSPHFVVVTNAGEKQAQRIAERFERIRFVFQAAFPRMRVDPAAPILVIAAKDEKSFKALEPESWRQKGQLRRSGIFLRGPEKNYVILRLDAEGDNPYHDLFHEYTHLLVHQNADSLPLWLDEGLAEFYGNSDIHEKEVWLGEPSASHLLLLRSTKLLPLATLFAVDHSSPYYNEENKGSTFYAESWALTPPDRGFCDSGQSRHGAGRCRASRVRGLAGA
ncbi:MAG: hypothetical protein DMG26_13230 [Acidobacteria bacterium]|nr:MAG: hypothetical protein DMG26_13230 [Acidobacteriota bacterium]